MLKDFVVCDYNDFSGEERNLIEVAKKATMLSYAPYSNFFVGSSLLLENGVVVSGANQENASFPLCMCAERVSLYSKSISYPEIKILKLAVLARKSTDYVAAACCGACRQVMIEYERRQARNFEVIMQIEPSKWLKSRSASVLMPFQFEF